MLVAWTSELIEAILNIYPRPVELLRHVAFSALGDAYNAEVLFAKMRALALCLLCGGIVSCSAIICPCVSGGEEGGVVLNFATSCRRRDVATCCIELSDNVLPTGWTDGRLAHEANVDPQNATLGNAY